MFTPGRHRDQPLHNNMRHTSVISGPKIIHCPDRRDLAWWRSGQLSHDLWNVASDVTLCKFGFDRFRIKIQILRPVTDSWDHSMDPEISQMTSNQIFWEHLSPPAVTRPTKQSQDSAPCCHGSLFTYLGAGQFYIRSGANNSCPGGSDGIIFVVRRLSAVRKQLLLGELGGGWEEDEGKSIIVSRTVMRRVKQWERILSQRVTPSITSRRSITQGGMFWSRLNLSKLESDEPNIQYFDTKFYHHDKYCSC